MIPHIRKNSDEGKMLKEALAHITDKPWDDRSFLHARICKALRLSIPYRGWVAEYLENNRDELDSDQIAVIEDILE
ncbi:hypothetical protein PJWF_00055 [Achromobacter phage JWF]|uniref:hypothetical protein n=1 Tax=Achromobacter phage JWF TaxID=1589748 RepID=UPI000588E6E2|nr:hypothetical protein AXJ13_gp055 [Achromobacter phage JWF]AJD82949.1 hypothetical protein PJWF_00055 [Achromobacter phage JWF]